MAHDIFEKSLEVSDFSPPFIKQTIKQIVQNSIQELYAIDQSEKEAEEFLQNFIPEMANFGATFLGEVPKQNAQIDCGDNFQNICIHEVIDIEESIWSPMFGIKGKLDATLNVRQKPVNQDTITSFKLPFELKTGKMVHGIAGLSHRAQVILYTLLMSDRHDLRDSISGGLLYYLTTGGMKRIPVRRGELVPLIMKRNELASYLQESATGELPSPIQHDIRACKYCYQNDSCFIYRKAKKNGEPLAQALEQIYKEKTDHLSEASLEYLTHWDDLINLESKGAESSRKEIWTMPSLEREARGRCFGKMIIDSIEPSASGFLHKFIRNPSDNSASKDLPIMDAKISVSDRVVISSEDGKIALDAGTVTQIRQRAITVRLTTSLKQIPAKGDSGGRQKTHPASSQFRIDVDEYTAGFAQIRSNLMSLFLSEQSGGNERLRSLVVDLSIPTFQLTNEFGISEALQQEYQKLNTDQQHAIEKALQTRDYSLILGMPGTGKSTTIVFLVRVFVDLKRSVLLTAYTHTAVDNLLMKLQKHGVDFLRLGSAHRVSRQLFKYTLSACEMNTVRQFSEIVSSKMVVATTCLGIRHPLFQKRKFDVCIVDEASQLTQPVCVGPLRFAETFILVGDHNQLPPLVRNINAREKGMDISLFKRLSEAHPKAVVNLSYQYRMNSDIMLLSNSVVYKNQLKCGTDEVATSKLGIPKLNQFEEILFSPKTSQTAADAQADAQRAAWLLSILQPKARSIFVDTDQVPGRERLVGRVTRNDVECSLVYQIVDAMILLGVNEQSIGVISPYRSQLKILRQLLKPFPGIAVDTIDRFQGKDKDCILMSFVRSNEQKKVGNLLADWRRANVAITRAKKKLILIGSLTTLTKNSHLSKLMQIFHNQNWIVKLPSSAHLAIPKYQKVFRHIANDTIPILISQLHGISFSQLSQLTQNTQQSNGGGLADVAIGGPPGFTRGTGRSTTGVTPASVGRVPASLGEAPKFTSGSLGSAHHSKKLSGSSRINGLQKSTSSYSILSRRRPKDKQSHLSSLTSSKPSSSSAPTKFRNSKQPHQPLVRTSNPRPPLHKSNSMPPSLIPRSNSSSRHIKRQHPNHHRSLSGASSAHSNTPFVPKTFAKSSRMTKAGQKAPRAVNPFAIKPRAQNHTETRHHVSASSSTLRPHKTVHRVEGRPQKRFCPGPITRNILDDRK